MKNNKQVFIKMSLIGILATGLIGGVTFTQTMASSTTEYEAVTEQNDATTLMDAKVAQNHLLSTHQAKQKQAEQQAQAIALTEQLHKIEAETKAAQEALQAQQQQQEVTKTQAASPQTTTATKTPATPVEDTTSTDTQTPATTPAPATQSVTTTQAASRRTVTTPQIPSSGLYIDGVSSQIASYNTDGGQVPTYTNLAYHWNTAEMASHNYYLVDNSNTTGLGQKVLALQNGDPVYLNGHLYHVTTSVTVYPGQYASDYFDFSHGLYIQTCYGAYASEGMRTVILD